MVCLAKETKSLDERGRGKPFCLGRYIGGWPCRAHLGKMPMNETSTATRARSFRIVFHVCHICHIGFVLGVAWTGTGIDDGDIRLDSYKKVHGWDYSGNIP